MADLGECQRLTGRCRADRKQAVDQVFTSVEGWKLQVRNVGAQVGLVLEGGEAGDRGLLVPPLRRGLKPRPMTDVKL